MTDEPKTPSTDEDITEDTIDRPAAAPKCPQCGGPIDKPAVFASHGGHSEPCEHEFHQGAVAPAPSKDWFDATMANVDKARATADRIKDLETRRDASRVQREATQRERLAKKAACDADRTLAVAMLYEAVHRAENFAHDIVYVDKALAKLKAISGLPPDATDYSESPYAESIAMLEARKEVAEEALPVLLDLRSHRKRILDLAELANDLETPSTEELWTLSGGAAALVSPYLYTWVMTKAEAAERAADPGDDPIPAGPTP